MRNNLHRLKEWSERSPGNYATAWLIVPITVGLVSLFTGPRKVWLAMAIGTGIMAYYAGRLAEQHNGERAWKWLYWAMAALAIILTVVHAWTPSEAELETS